MKKCLFTVLAVLLCAVFCMGSVVIAEPAAIPNATLYEQPVF